MTVLKIKSAPLGGEVCIPSSKSMGHREIICAALAKGKSIVDNISMSEDIEATLRSLKAMGIYSEAVPSAFKGRSAFVVYGTGEPTATGVPVDCGESGSTVRFLMPLGALCGENITFIGRGRLGERPLKAYYDIFDKQGVKWQTAPSGGMPTTICGKLRGGRYELPGNVSSQFVSGLLFTLPLLEEDSEIVITSSLESQSYVALTLSALARYGIKIQNENWQRYIIPGGQQYKSFDSVVEGDWSQAAFWLVAGCIGKGMTCTGISCDSLQGDRVVVDILKRMGADIRETEQGLEIYPSKLHGVKIDASDCPDIIPVLTVAAAVSEGTTEIINAGRLRIKECDRLAAISTELNKVGAEVEELPDGLIVHGKPEGLFGGSVDAWNDHRIAMSMAVASMVCRNDVIISGSESVKKSYPEFWQDFKAVAGRIEIMGE